MLVCFRLNQIVGRRDRKTAMQMPQSPLVFSRVVFFIPSHRSSPRAAPPPLYTRLPAAVQEIVQIVFFRSEYEYGFIVKHFPDSLGDALGVHVTWMLTPFVKFNKATSSSLVGSYRVEQKGDSVTFKASE